MRVMILTALYPPIIHGGAEKAAWRLAEALAADGDEVSVITMHPNKVESIETINGVRVYRIPMDNLYWPFGREVKPPSGKRLLWHLRDMWNTKTAARVARILDLEGPDVVNSHLIIGFSPAVWREVKKRGIRLVHTIHDYYSMCPRADMFNDSRACERQCLQCKALTLSRKFSSRHIDSVISVSNYVLDAHSTRNYFPNARTSVVYNIATPHRNESDPGIDHAADLDPENLVFGFLGRLDKFKGIHTLLAATRLLVRDNWRLRIGGAGLETNVQASKREYTDPRIEWLGFADADDYFRSIHVSVVPSLWADPLPYVVIESHLYGKAILHSNSGGIPEAAAFGKKTAAFPAGDAVALAALMNYALANRSEWLRGGFRDPAAINLFSAKTIAEEYREIYRGG